MSSIDRQTPTQEQYLELLSNAFPPADFHKGAQENPRFWKRLGGMPLIRDSVVLDVGCGSGSLCIDMAKAGAKKVVGIDVNPQIIAFAKRNLELNYPELVDRVDFVLAYLHEYPEDPKFDFITSKDAFEHIIDLKGNLEDMVKRLNDGGSIYIGLGPLWHSAFGDHGRTEMIVPWGHLLVSESSLLKKLNRKRDVKLNSLQDLGLNLLSVEDYMNIFSECGLDTVYLGFNVSDNLISRVLTAIAKISILKRYCTFNIYCILKKVDSTRS